MKSSVHLPTAPLIVLLLFCIWTSNTFAQRFRFRQHQVDNGLSENTVRTILQDRDGFMWFGTKDGLNRFDGHGYRIYRHDSREEGSIGNNFIYSIFEDKKGNLWVGTDKGIYVRNPVTDYFTYFDVKSQDGLRINSAVNSICADNDGNIWIATSALDLFRYNSKNASLKHYRSGDAGYFPVSDCIWQVYKDRAGVVWIAARQGMARYDPKTDSFIIYKIQKENFTGSDILCVLEDSDEDMWFGTWADGLICLNQKWGTSVLRFGEGDNPNISHIRSLFEYEKGKIMIGADDGLFLFDKHQKSCFRIDDPNDPHGLSDHNVYSICGDRENGIWIGTYFGGVNYISPTNSAIEHYYPTGAPGALCGKAVSQFCEDEKGNMWIATEDGGLNYFNTTTKRFINYPGQNPSKGLSYFNLHSLVLDKQKLWIGTFSRGIDLLDLKTGRFSNFRHNKNDSMSIPDDCIFSLYKDSQNRIYVGTPWGLAYYDRSGNNFRRIPEVSGFVYDIEQDQSGKLWVGCYLDGVFCYDPQKKSWRHYTHDPNNPRSLCFNKIIDIYIDGKERLWFSSEGGGICQYHYQTDDFTTINQVNGLPNNIIYGALDDWFGNLWVSSNSGITQINLSDTTMRTYGVGEGLQSNQFNYRSSYKSRDGLLYFGGINGFNVIHPELLSSKSSKRPVMITRFEIIQKNRAGSQNRENVVNLSKTGNRKIRLPRSESSFRIDFITLNYNSLQDNYAYIMEGLTENWMDIGSQRQISCINLPPGTYTFRVAEAGKTATWEKNGDWLEITILPPLWQCTVAYILYAIVIVLGVFLSIRHYLRNLHRKEKAKMDASFIQKEKESYDSKINFFTNVAHEIRTPLSLIKVPLESIVSSGDGTAATRENLHIIEKNTDRLLNLISQLLDFRRIENNIYKIKFSAVSINELLKEICISFRMAAESRRIQFDMDLPSEDILASADRDGLTKVVSNLLMNGLKYAVGQIKLTLSRASVDGMNYFRIYVDDDGSGVAEQYRNDVFEPFYQIESSTTSIRKTGTGTGIGLALSKQLVEQHRGLIKVETSPLGGARFVLLIPTGTDITLEREIVQPEKETDEKDVRQRTSILVVEDNDELRCLIAQNLDREYCVLTARDGEEALERIREENIELVVTDIVMPRMDGLQLTATVKQDPELCHISVILLSARTNVQSKVDGMECGADSYIEKPFSIAFLKAQISSLLENKHKLMEKYFRSPFMPSEMIARNKKDEEFLHRFNEEIEKNMSNENFNIDKLSDSLFMCRSKLQRKVKGISGLSVNDYIRIVRLKKAANLLIGGECQINEVCFIVGFNTPSYFTKCFKEQFGMLPTDFMKTAQQEDNQP